MRFVANLNETVTVRLTEHGRAVWLAYWGDVIKDAGGEVPRWVARKAVTGEPVPFQLHELFHVFGKECFNGGKMVFEHNEIEFKGGE